MKTNMALVLALLGVLAACGGGDGTNPVNRPGSGDDGGGDDGGDIENPIEPGDDTTSGVPDALALNVADVDYDLENDRLIVTMNGLDGNENPEVFERDARLDVPGYLAYSQQTSALNRMYVAVAQESADGDVKATAISDGGQFTVFYSGTHYERAGDYEAPVAGSVAYAGTYAGVSNFDDPDGDELLVPGGSPDASILPAQPSQTTGDIFLNVNFADNEVEGAIYNKTYRHDNTVDLPDVYLTDGELDDNGEFLGTAEESTRAKSGEFGGVISSDHNAVAGTVVIQEDLDGGTLRENGVFVLPICGDGDTGVCEDASTFFDD